MKSHISRLKIISIDPDFPEKSICRCNCGNTVSILSRAVKSGKTKSCGCLRREVTRERSTKHGFASRKNRHSIYNTWRHMFSRCNNRNGPSWKYYGGSGIKVCKRWNSFDNFVSDMLGSWEKGLTIERKNNSLGYFKENCIWADSKTQNRNKRNAKLITCNGETLNASAWAERLGGNMDIVYVRLRRGWSEHDAVTIPAQPIGTNQASSLR